MGIKDTFPRKPSLSYDCPHCEERLKSPLMDAGTEDTCPHCHQVFTVPGEEEKQEYQDKITAEQVAKERAKAERLAEQEDLNQRNRKRQELDKEKLNALRKAQDETFEKACPAGWPPIVVAGMGGLIFFFFAFLYDTSLTVETITVNNLGLLLNRLIGCITGVVLFVGGAAINEITRAMVKIHKDQS